MEAVYNAVVISPDGSKFAGIVGDASEAQLQIAELTSGATLAASPLKNVTVVGINWAGPDHLVATFRSDGRAADGILRVAYAAQHFDLRQRKWSPLMHNRAGMSESLHKPAETRVIAGRPYAFLTTTATAAGNWAPVIARIDLETGRHIQSEVGNVATQEWVIGADGRAVARIDHDPKLGRWQILKRPMPTAQWTLVESIYAKVDLPSLLGFGRTSDELDYSMMVDGDRRVVHHKINTGERTVEPLDTTPTYTYFNSPTGLQVATSIETFATLDTSFFAPADQKLWDNILTVFPGERVFFNDWSADRNRIIVSVNGRKSGAGIFLVDRRARTASRIADDYPGVKAADIAEIRPIRFTASDGLEIPAYLTLPPDGLAKALPLVILAKSWLEARDTAAYHWQPQALASRGYAVLQVQARGTKGLGKELEVAGKGAFGRKMQTDLSDGLRYLVSKGLVDPARVCIIGSEFGGYVALTAIADEPASYRCAAGIFGIYDLRKQLQRHREFQQIAGNGRPYQHLLQLVGAANNADPLLTKLSPVNKAASIAAPVLLIGSKGNRVQSDAMEAALRDTGQSVERVTLTADDPWSMRNPERIQMIEALVAFLERHNPPGPLPQ